MENIDKLKDKITKSNLKKKDKEKLIELLNKKHINLNSLVKTVLTTLKVGKEILKLFDIGGDDE